MTEKPIISVVMSAYNNADTLATAMDSILSQEGVQLEFIVVNDGSTDGSATILEDYARRDARVRVVHQENTGLTRALIRGCSLARAPWIARQDADDISLPGRLRQQLDYGRADEQIDLVGCHARYFSPEGDALTVVEAPVDRDEARRLLLRDRPSISPHGSILFRRASYEAIGGYRPAFYYAQDVDLNVRLAEQGDVIAVPACLYAYRFSPNTISGRHARHQAAFYRLIRDSQRLRAAGMPDDEVLAQAVALSAACRQGGAHSGDNFDGNYFTGSCLLATQPHKARRYLWQALKSRPWSIKAWAKLLITGMRISGNRS